MDKVYLKSLFTAEKDFLKKLYKGEEGVSILMLANDKSLNVVIQILHLLAIGEIPMKQETESLLKSSRKYNKLRQFTGKDFFRQLLYKASRETKVKELKQFVKVFPSIFYSLFNEL